MKGTFRAPAARRALVLGGRGMLGRAVVELWRRRGTAALGIDIEHVDITEKESVLGWIASFRPELVVNCAAFTQVDACESERETAIRVNGTALRHVAEAAAAGGADLVHISTDYVFDGNGPDGERVPYPVDAATGPSSAYGESKLLGEQNALAYERSQVIRTSWLFGPHGPNFVATMLRLAKTNPTLKVVDDQLGCPTYAPFLARAVWDLQASGLYGVFHYCNRDAVSWYGFAREILGPGVDVRPCTTAEFPRPAPRPAWSVLDTSRFEEAVGRRVEPWLTGLSAYLDSSGE